MRQIRRWQQAQLTYMPGATSLSLPARNLVVNEDDTEDSDTPEKFPLIFPSNVGSAQRGSICLHRVTEYEQHLRLAQLQDSLIELRRARRVRHTLLVHHQTQIAGQGQRANTRSRTIIKSVEERISKFAQRYRAAYNALVQLDPTGDWQETYLELKDKDNRGPGKEDDEQGPGDGSYTFSWIWLTNPRAHDTNHVAHGGEASDEDINDVMRVQWATSQARTERWVEEVELLQEEMRRVVVFLEWKSEDWLEKQTARLTTAPSSIQSGLRAYARKQAAIHHNLAVSFVTLWYPTFASFHLKDSWITDYAATHSIQLPKSFDPTSQTQKTSKARIIGKGDRGHVQVAVPLPIQSQQPLYATTDDSAMQLEEYVGDDDEDENVDSEAWDSLDGSSDDYDDGYDDFDPY